MESARDGPNSRDSKMARIKIRQLAALCRRVGTALEAGVDVRRIWSREVERASLLSRGSLAAVSRTIAGGDSMTDAIAAGDGYFPPMVREMVEVGEKTGHLDRVFLQLAEHYERQLALRRTFIAGIIWPMIQLAAAVLIVGLLILAMGWVRQLTGVDIDLLGFGLVGVSGFLIYGAIVTGIAIAAVIVIRGAARGWFWVAPLQRAIMMVPVLGSSLKTLALARMSWTLAVTLDSAMDTAQAVALALRSTQNIFFTRQIPSATATISRGGEIHEALRGAGSYPNEFIDAIEVGEQSGRLSESLMKLSKNYEDRARAALNALTVVAGFLVWGLVALVLVMLIFKLAMFYIGMINNAAQGRFPGDV